MSVFSETGIFLRAFYKQQKKSLSGNKTMDTQPARRKRICERQIKLKGE
jgi:hypothetical protein